MNVHEFIRQRPCLEEIDGFLEGLRFQEIQITEEIMKPLEDYRGRMMKGREIPVPTKLHRRWTYRSKFKPVRNLR